MNCPYNPDIHRRRSIRLQQYDYSSVGAYFVTICVQERECLFGVVVNGAMELNKAGRIVEEWWARLPDKFPLIELDEFVVMPNHVHGIIVIHENGVCNPVGAIHESPRKYVRAIHELPLHVPRMDRRKMLLPKIVGFFKMNTAKHINLMRDNTGAPLWQRNYHEHIIRNEEEFAAIREYVRSNAIRWENDEENPA